MEILRDKGEVRPCQLERDIVSAARAVDLKSPDWREQAKPLIELIPELAAMDFEFYNPACEGTVLEHSIRVAQALPDYLVLTGLLHDIGKIKCQVMEDNHNGPEFPRVMRFTGHEMAGADLAKPILERILVDWLGQPHWAKVSHMLKLNRFHDSRGRYFERDFDEMIGAFETEAEIEDLFLLWQADDDAHTKEHVAKSGPVLESNIMETREYYRNLF